MKMWVQPAEKKDNKKEKAINWNLMSLACDKAA